MQTMEFSRLEFNFKLPSEQVRYRCKKFASSEFVSVNFFRMYRLATTYFLFYN